MIKTGMGGIIYYKKNEAIFSFSGPSSADSPFQSEWLALQFLVNAFCKSTRKEHSITVFSDCKEFVQKVREFMTSSCDQGSSIFPEDIKLTNWEIRYFQSDINTVADTLAKKGANSGNLKSFWAKYRNDSDKMGSGPRAFSQ